jgi:hypothetical protein
MKISTPGWRHVLPGGREKASTHMGSMAVARWATLLGKAARIRTRTFYRVCRFFGKVEANVALESQLTRVSPQRQHFVNRMPGIV